MKRLLLMLVFVITALNSYAFISNSTAVLSKDGKTLTFYKSGMGKVYAEEGLDTFSVCSTDECTLKDYEHRDQVENVFFDESMKEEKVYLYPYQLFSGFKSLKRIEGFANVKIEGGTNVKDMFKDCESLEYIDMSKVIVENGGRLLVKDRDLNYMFDGCKRLKYVDISCFSVCDSITGMEGLFKGCDSLRAVDLTWLPKGKVASIAHMFEGCSQLTEIDFGNLNIQRITKADSAFYGCSSLTTIYTNNQGLKTSAATSKEMFHGCTNLVGQSGTGYSSDKIDGTYACIDNSLQEGYFTERATGRKACAVMSNDKTTFTFYCDCNDHSSEGTVYELKEFDSSLDYKDQEEPDWAGVNRTTTKVVFDKSFQYARPTTTYRWFYQFYALKDIEGLEYLNLSEAVNFYETFCYTDGLTDADFSYFCVPSAVYTERMFPYCGAANLSLKGIISDDILSIQEMFASCNNLKTLDISNLKTSNVTSMCKMFYDCGNLKYVDMANCVSSNVDNMQEMFMNCTNLEEVNINSFTTSATPSADKMFSGCKSLSVVYASEAFDGAGLSSGNDMFKDCNAIVGAMGTCYDGSYVNDDYARIDKGPATPGYFTDINGVRARGVLSADKKTLRFVCNAEDYSDYGVSYPLSATSSGARWVNGQTTKVIFESDFSNVTPISTSNWLKNMSSLETVEGFENINMSAAVKASSMFENCTSLKNLDLSALNMRNVNDASSMFSGCSALESISFGDEFTLENAGSIHGMFSQCSSLKSIDLSRFNTKNGATFDNMFYGCSNLKVIAVSSGFTTDTENFKSAANMFHGCTSLVGEMGTCYNKSYVDNRYAVIDGGDTKPGYFTDINSCIVIGPSGYATYCSDEDLDFSGETGFNSYIVSGYNKTTGKTLLVNVKEAPAYTGLLLIGTPGAYQKNSSYVSTLFSNRLVGVAANTSIAQADGSYTNYILANGSHGIAFYKVASEGGLIKANRAYLQLPSDDVASAKYVRFAFCDDETTGLGSVSAEDNAGEAVYNLAGQKVGSNYKGLVIKNGKKVYKK